MRGARGESKRPKSVVVARSADGTRELAAGLKRLGVRPIPVETIEFQEPSDWADVDEVLKGLTLYDWVVLTSARGAGALGARVRELSVTRSRERPRVAAVGERTAARLESEGFRVDFVPSKYTTACLGRELPRGFGEKVLLLRADSASEELERILKERKFSVTSVPVYRTRVLSSPFRGTGVEGAAVVVFGSPMEVEGLSRRLPVSAYRKLRSDAVAACIGPVTAKAARRAGFRRVSSPNPHTFEELLMVVKRSVAG